MNYWLIKSEPSEFSIEDLRRAPARTAHWDGVRNYQARNYMRDGMRVGDGVLFYHSSCELPGVAGVARVASAPYPDPSQFDEGSEYFDAKAMAENPRWVLVDFEFVAEFPAVVSLAAMREDPKLEGMVVLRRGNRLSVMPVAKEHWDFILALEEKQP